TKPSPPLLPFPQRIMARLPRMGANSFAITCAAPAPAFSMRRGPGIPSCWIARASTARISDAVKIGRTSALPRDEEGRRLGQNGAQDVGGGMAVRGPRRTRRVDLERALSAERSCRHGDLNGLETRRP